MPGRANDRSHPDVPRTAAYRTTARAGPQPSGGPADAAYVRVATADSIQYLAIAYKTKGGLGQGGCALPEMIIKGK